MKILLSAVALLIFLGCKEKSNTAEATASQTLQKANKERNKQTALWCINAWDRGDIEGILKHLHPDAVDYGDGSTPPAVGVDAFKSFMETWRFSVENYKSSDEIAVADGDYVFIYAGWSGAFKNDFMGMKTAGKSFHFRDVDIFKFDGEGKITEHRAVLFSTMLKDLASK